MKKAWLAMMLPDNRHAWQVSVSRLSARLRCRSPPRAWHYKKGPGATPGPWWL